MFSESSQLFSKAITYSTSKEASKLKWNFEMKDDSKTDDKNGQKKHYDAFSKDIPDSDPATKEAFSSVPQKQVCFKNATCLHFGCWVCVLGEKIFLNRVKSWSAYYLFCKFARFF